MFIGTYYTKRIFYINTVILLLIYILPESVIRPFVDMFSLHSIGDGFNPIQLITYMFLHADFSHVFSNMIFLLFFAPAVEIELGSKKFLRYYIIMGITSAIGYMLFKEGTMVGASGAVFGVFTYHFLINPTVKFYKLIPLTWIFWFMISKEIYHLWFPLERIAHISHLTGVLTGLFLYLKENNWKLTNYKKYLNLKIS